MPAEFSDELDQYGLALPFDSYLDCGDEDTLVGRSQRYVAQTVHRRDGRPVARSTGIGQDLRYELRCSASVGGEALAVKLPTHGAQELREVQGLGEEGTALANHLVNQFQVGIGRGVEDGQVGMALADPVGELDSRAVLEDKVDDDGRGKLGFYGALSGGDRIRDAAEDSLGQ